LVLRETDTGRTHWDDPESDPLAEANAQRLAVNPGVPQHEAVRGVQERVLQAADSAWTRETPLSLQ
jgi:hypothetical protein